MKLKDLKLKKDVHDHLEEMGLVTFEDLKEEVNANEQVFLNMHLCN